MTGITWCLMVPFIMRGLRCYWMVVILKTGVRPQVDRKGQRV
jgi:hypothetical protein